MAELVGGHGDHGSLPCGNLDTFRRGAAGGKGQIAATGSAQRRGNKEHGGHAATGISGSTSRCATEMRRQKRTKWREDRRHLQWPSNGGTRKGAYDPNGARNAVFLKAKNVGPFPEAMRYARSHVSLDAAHNLGLKKLSTLEEWGNLGALAMETSTDVRNRGAGEMMWIAGVEMGGNTRGKRNERAQPREASGN